MVLCRRSKRRRVIFPRDRVARPNLKQKHSYVDTAQEPERINACEACCGT